MEIGSVEQAKQAVDAGVDAIIVQGLEAGGHVLGKVSVHVVLLCNYKSLMASYLDQ
jgi:NAD(P)H-dependent flavin oxidoreductase YrpB (nitropropane dioxygenase family)